MKYLINSYIDHTLLKPDTTLNEIQKLCKEAVDYSFYSVCINPFWTSRAVEALKGTTVKVCTVVGFPLGAGLSEMKAAEAKRLAELGAQELDMVMNIGALKSKEYQKVQKDIEGVVRSAPNTTIKVIIETCLLTEDEKVNASKIVVDAGAHFVKTSTGFSKSGATLQDIELLRRVVGTKFGVKASGGVRDLSTAEAMIKAGATRIGTSSGLAIMQAIQNPDHTNY